MIADATGSQKRTIQAFLNGGVHTVLDVGCGTGEKTSFIARYAGCTVGIDPDAGSIRKAQPRYGGRHLCFQVARAESLCFAGASFDAVFFNESLHHVPAGHLETALRESRRVLKPGGRMLIIEPIHGSGALGQTMRLYRDEKVQEQNAIEAIESVVSTGFALHALAEIQIEYSFADFEEFYGFYMMTRPEAKSDTMLKRDMRARFDRCRRNLVGHTVIDYAASVRQLVKA